VNEAELQTLLRGLLAVSGETEWLEFKHNQAREEEIGEYISALANASALHEKDVGYIVWGIEDFTRRVVGTSFQPRLTKVGNEELEAWLTLHLAPRIDFRFHEFGLDGHRIVMLAIPAARHTPVRFKESEWIRVGTYKKKLKDFPEKARSLWLRCSHSVFESEIAADTLVGEEVLQWLDYACYFELLQRPLPTGQTAILERMEQEGLVRSAKAGRFDITNLGAILFARRLDDFKGLSRRALRIIEYTGTDRVKRGREHSPNKGYAAGFSELLQYFNARLPKNDVMGEALRREVPMYPPLAVRELVANALIHQDFRATGVGPMVEIFTDRIEVTNPGEPLVEPLRFLDSPPRSRNEVTAALMRRLGICEEGGSGIDKVVFEVEFYQLPAPDFQVVQGGTRSILFAHKPLASMDSKDKRRACYLHACLECVSHRQMTNATLRKRLGISDENYPVASRIIAETISARLIKLHDPNSRSRKHARYVPYWA